MVGPVQQGQVAAERPGQATGDRQPQATAGGLPRLPLPSGVEPDEPVEDAVVISRWDARTGVGDDQAVRAHPDADPATRRGGPAGVVEQVQHYSIQGIAIAADPGPGAGTADGAVRTLLGESAHRGAGDLRQVDRLRAGHRGTALQPRHEQQVVDQPAGPLSLPDEGHQPLLAHCPGRVVAQHPFGRGDHARDRGTQVVRSVGQELPHPPLRRHRLGLGQLQCIEHVVEGGRRPSQIGLRAPRAQPTAPGTVAGAPGNRGHPRQRGQREPDQHGEQHAGQQQGADAGRQLDALQGGQRPVDVGQVRGQRQRSLLYRKGELQQLTALDEGHRGGRCGRTRTARTAASGVRWRLIPAHDDLAVRRVAGGDALAGQAVRERLGVQVLRGQHLREPGPVGQSGPQIGTQAVAEHEVDHQAQSDEHHQQQREHREEDPLPERPGTQASLLVRTRADAPHRLLIRYPTPRTVWISRSPSTSSLRRSADTNVSTRFGS